jgi:hypothetical protein
MSPTTTCCLADDCPAGWAGPGGVAISAGSVTVRCAAPTNPTANYGASD